MRKGDIIIQRIFMPPLGYGICFEFAVKVKELFLEKNKVGFSYETLKGHPESGLSEFYFEQKENKVHFTIHTLSRPSHWGAKLTKKLLCFALSKLVHTKSNRKCCTKYKTHPKIKPDIKYVQI